ncbi:hypothetical protein LOAG_04012 [Loa loa]|uniref:Uncharacterized protein n=1 Tax=Loa loa TaxID=7209 RepID=A0A1S0U341_LOALO|nr:hypothetical protein LOAG_04012 [Loa loa]EFO24474.2 hypothetical protein LOAG_04012 [Loa loa]
MYFLILCKAYRWKNRRILEVRGERTVLHVAKLKNKGRTKRNSCLSLLLSLKCALVTMPNIPSLERAMIHLAHLGDRGTSVTAVRRFDNKRHPLQKRDIIGKKKWRKEEKRRGTHISQQPRILCQIYLLQIDGMHQY